MSTFLINIIARKLFTGLIIPYLSLNTTEKLSQKSSSRLELGTLFRSADLSAFFFCSQGISMPSLVQIGVSVLEQEVNIHTHARFQFRM
jgi:phage gp29-like protein